MLIILIRPTSLRTYTKVHERTRMYTNVHERTRMYTNAHERTRTYTNVHKCTRRYANVHERTRTYTNVSKPPSSELFFLVYVVATSEKTPKQRPREHQGPVHTDAFSFEMQTFCCVFMSRPNENDENDVSFSMKTQTFENALQSGKI